MTNEKDFLHQISNHLAAAKVSVEILLETEQESSQPDPDRKSLLEQAMRSLKDLHTAVAQRREKLEA